MLTPLLSILSGVIVHLLIFIHGEWDAYSGRLVAFGVLIHLLLAYALGQISTLTWTASHRAALILELHHLAGLSSSIIIYRLFFHRLRDFPGPLGGKIWIWDLFIKIWRSGERQSVVLDKLHAKYGPIVRYAPDRLSINYAAAVPAIHGTGSTAKCTKSVIYLNPVNGGSINAERDPQIHHARRNVWERAMSSRVLPTYIPPFTQLTSALVMRFRSLEGNPTITNHHMELFAFDAMGSIGFGRPGGFDGLATGVLYPAITELMDMMSIGVYMMLIPWLHVLLDYMPTMGIIYKPDEVFRQFVKKELGQYCDIKGTKPEKDEEARPASVNNPSTHQVKLPFRDILSQVHPEPDLNDRRTLSDTVILSIAGADTTTSSLVHAVYRLARHHDIQSKILRELEESNCPGIDNNLESEERFSAWMQSAKLPFLQAFIKEVLRLHPPSPTGLARTTPAEGLTITHSNGETTFIPGLTNVSVPIYSIGRDPRYFEQALDFIPERFLPGSHVDARTDLVLDGRAYMPFLQGPYGCPGKQLAYLESKIVIAGLVSAFEIVFPEATDMEDLITRVETQWQDFTAVKAVPLEVQYLPRLSQK